MATIHTMSARPEDWAFPVPVTFGAGRISALPELMKAKGVRRPLVITDKGGDRHRIYNLIAAAGLTPVLFDKVEPNPTDVCVRNASALFHAEKCDAIVAIGGGSGLDGGKSTAMVAGSGLPVSDFEWTLPPVKLAPGALPSVWLVPTTAGTGAEMDSASMVTDTTKKIKICVAHPDLVTHVVMDPKLTLTLPATLTAWTGMDALTHALEALSVDMYHPMCDGIALEALRLIQTWLPVAFREGSTSLEARSQMLAASCMAAVAFQKGLGATHGLSEPIGAVHNTQHGLTNAIVLPVVLRANRKAIESKMELVSRYLSLPQPPASYLGGSSGGHNKDGGFERVCFWVDSLSEALNIPTSLRSIGLDESSRAALGVKAEANPTGWTNPIRFSAAEYERIYQKALDGHERSVFYDWDVSGRADHASAAKQGGAGARAGVGGSGAGGQPTAQASWSMANARSKL